MTGPGLALVAAALVAPAWLHGFEIATNPGDLTGTAVVQQDYTIGYLWRQDVQGCVYGPFVDADLRQKLVDNFTARADLRIFKAAGSDDPAGIFLEDADVAYVGSWLSVMGGRRDLTDFLGPGRFFGAYSTMGERWLDSIGATVPFRFTADIPDADAEVAAPYNALSILYVPDLFDTAVSDFSGRQGLVLAQLKAKFRIKEDSADAMVNGTYGLADWFLNSPVDETGSLDASADFRGGGWKLWGEWAMQNLVRGSGTSVLAAGGTLGIARWTLNALRDLAVEVQIPLGSDPANPFTGGDPQDPLLGGTPSYCWFVQLRGDWGSRGGDQRLGLFYGAAVTTSVGDYTLARLANGTLNQPLGSGFGEGYRVQYMSLRASSYQAPAGIVYAGYRF